MVPVATDHSFQIFHMPGIEYEIIILRFLTNSPGIKCFNHDEKPHLVTKIYKFRGRRVVTCPDGIAAHLLQYFKLPCSSTCIKSCSKSSQIMMVTNSSYFNSFAIEQETITCSKIQSSEAKICFISVCNSCSLHHNNSYPVKFRLSYIP